MEDQANNVANRDGQSVVSGRRPGRPKGLPRPAGSGRKKGTPNRATRDLREAAQKYTAQALKELAGMLSDPDPKVKLGAIREILDRGHGKPISPSEITGKDGSPLIPDQDDSTIARGRRIAFALELASRAGDEASRELLDKYKERAAARAGCDAEQPATWHAPAAPPGPPPVAAEPERDEAAIAKAQADMEITRKTDAIIAQSRSRMGGPRVVQFRPKQ